MYKKLQDIADEGVELERCRPHPDNYNHHPPAQIERLRASLRKFGQVRSIVVQAPPQREGYYLVVAGHGVVEAAKLEGYKTLVARVVPADWPPQRVVAYLAADNELARQAEADTEQLASILQDIRDFDEELLEVVGFSDADLEALLAELSAALGGEVNDPGPRFDQAGELRQKWSTAPGQLWQLGRHRLICGDCTEAAVVRQLMDGQRAVLFATDPPYLVDYDGTNHPQAWNKPQPSMNKDWSDQYHDWDNAEQGAALYDGFVEVALAEAITDRAAWYCWHASRNQAMVEGVWERYGAFVHQQIIWVKDRPILTRSWYMWQHEPCFFGWLRGKKPANVVGDHPRTVWEVATVAAFEQTAHPTSKPVELFAIPMEQHTKPGDICYEPFSGSGSQIIAGEQLGRRVYACEINPAFVAVALQRWSEATGQEPVLL